MPSIAMGVTRMGGGTIHWEVGANGTRGRLSVSASVGSTNVIVESIDGTTMTRRGLVDLGPPGMGDVSFRAIVTDSAYGGSLSTVETSGWLKSGTNWAQSEKVLP